MSITALTFKIRQELTAADCDGIIDLYNSISWGGNYSHDEIKAMYDCRNYCGMLQANGEVVAIIRAFGDESTITWLAELAVHAKVQKLGYGAMLMIEFLRSHSHTAIYMEALPGQEGFFSKFGIIPKPTLTACSRAAVSRVI